MYVITNRTAVTSWWCPSDNHVHAIFSRYRDLHLSVCVPVSRSSLSPRWFCIYVFLCYSAVSVCCLYSSLNHLLPLSVSVSLSPSLPLSLSTTCGYVIASPYGCNLFLCHFLASYQSTVASFDQSTEVSFGSKDSTAVNRGRPMIRLCRHILTLILSTGKATLDGVAVSEAEVPIGSEANIKER